MQATEFVKAWRAKVQEWQERLPARPEVLSQEGLMELFAGGTPLITAVQPPVPPHLFQEAFVQVGRLWVEHAAGVVGTDGAAAVGTDGATAVGTDGAAAVATDGAAAVGTEGAAHAGTGGATARWQELEQAVAQAGKTDLEQLISAGVQGQLPALDEWARRRGVDPDLLMTLMELALQPFLVKFATGLDRVAPISVWRDHHCPVCGREADLARIDPDNLRWLHCPLCDTQWQHHRLSCVWCDTDDTEKVELLSAEGYEPWWVETCDACGGYIKTLDQRHDSTLARGWVDLYVADARTLALDLLAQREGYQRGGRRT